MRGRNQRGLISTSLLKVRPLTEPLISMWDILGWKNLLLSDLFFGRFTHVDDWEHKRICGWNLTHIALHIIHVFSVFIISLLTELCPKGMDKRGTNISRKVKEISNFTGNLNNSIIYKHFIRFWLMNCNK